MSDCDGQCSEDLKRYDDENAHLRRLLWLRHGCPSSALYGDDGEMQCGACGTDFRRMTVTDLEKLMRPT